MAIDINTQARVVAMLPDRLYFARLLSGHLAGSVWVELIFLLEIYNMFITSIFSLVHATVPQPHTY